jgi:hypothetical protein
MRSSKQGGALKACSLRDLKHLLGFYLGSLLGVYNLVWLIF